MSVTLTNSHLQRRGYHGKPSVARRSFQVRHAQPARSDIKDDLERCLGLAHVAHLYLGTDTPKYFAPNLKSHVTLKFSFSLWNSPCRTFSAVFDSHTS
jgi:hypothetical protein